MPRPKTVSKEDLAEICRDLHHQGIGEIHMRRFSNEEEDSREALKAFQEIGDLGYALHTLRVISDRGKSFEVHVDSAYRR